MLMVPFPVDNTLTNPDKNSPASIGGGMNYHIAFGALAVRIHPLLFSSCFMRLKDICR